MCRVHIIQVFNDTDLHLNVNGSILLGKVHHSYVENKLKADILIYFVYSVGTLK